MNQEQLKQFKNWFRNYVDIRYGNDSDLNENLKLKDVHTDFVCIEMRGLTEYLKLNENQCLIAETVALFHDIGRFEQFLRYGTYSDVETINHSCFGRGILEQEKILDMLDPEEREIILTAIQFHGEKEIPDKLDEETTLHLKLIRDADKIDIYRVVSEYTKEYLANPEAFKINLEFKDEPHCSDLILESLFNKTTVDYKHVQTLNDMRLLQLGWVYDINFTYSLRKISERGYLQELIDLLPDTDKVRAACRCVLDFVENQIKEDTL